MKNKIVVSALIISIALVTSAFVFGEFLYKSREQVKTIKVVGSEKEFYEADMVKWKMSLEEVSKVNEVKKGYEKLKEKKEKLMKVLLEKGIQKENITFKPINVYDDYDRNGQVSGNKLNQQVYIISKKVELIEKIAINPTELFEKNIFVKYSNLEYFNSKVDEIKKELLAKATVNAKERAEKILENTDIKVDKMMSVRAGVFQITEPYSTRMESYGVYNTSTKKKQIRVTVHTVFTLK